VSYYRILALRILRVAYSLTTPEALRLSELVELVGTEQDKERILPDNDRQRYDRLQRLTTALRDAIDDCARRRIRPPLSESTLAPGSFVSNFANKEGLSPEQQDSYARHRLLPDMLQALYSLDPREFEVLCGRVLSLLGCRNISVTQAQKDDGVDAISELPMLAGMRFDQNVTLPPLYRFAGHISFLVYTQAKRYSEGHKVGQEEVLELEGSWRATRNSYFEGTLAPERTTALRRADYRIADPVLLVLMTTSSFTAGALAKAESVGIVTIDGEQLAQLLLESSFGIGLREGKYVTSVEEVRDAIDRT
jgi:Restriction endonuclease